MISFQDAQTTLNAFCHRWLKQTPIAPQSIRLDHAIGFSLAEAVHAHVDLPYDNLSAMDGYALCFHHGDDIANANQVFSVIGESKAGTPFNGSLTPGNAIRIMTGAVVPDSAHTVVMQENVTQTGASIYINQITPTFKNIRARGEEIQQSQQLFESGQRITPSVISVLASQGIANVSVYRPLNIGFFSSGDELRTAGEALDRGNLFESNLHAIEALLSPLPVRLHNLGIIPDQQTLHRLK